MQPLQEVDPIEPPDQDDAPPDVKRRLGEAIKNARLGKELTQRDLAEAVGVHQPSVSAWELGRTMPSPTTMINLAALLGLDLSQVADRPPEAEAVETEAVA